MSENVKFHYVPTLFRVLNSITHLGILARIAVISLTVQDLCNRSSKIIMFYLVLKALKSSWTCETQRTQIPWQRMPMSDIIQVKLSLQQFTILLIFSSKPGKYSERKDNLILSKTVSKLRHSQLKSWPVKHNLSSALRKPGISLKYSARGALQGRHNIF